LHLAASPNGAADNRRKKMSARKAGFVVALVLACAVAGTLAAQTKDVPKSLVRFSTETLAEMGKDSQLAGLVDKDNQKPAAVEKLRELDKRWKAKDNIEDLVKSVLTSPAAARLKMLIGEHAYIPEAFVMNAQGTIIGETNRTSTYWKAEQEKFSAAYAGGAGAMWYGKLEYDESTQTNGVQISVPVLKGGKAIGAICFTINVDAWEKR
jgi:hypothetical protein